MSSPARALRTEERDERVILGVTRNQRYRFYLWSAVVLAVGFLGWALFYLKPHRWYTYTDQIAFEQRAGDVELGYVLWENAEEAKSGLSSSDEIGTPVISSSGA
ncbi:MAG: hypothetical protein VCD16_09070, partial [Planctomycetota bacterium]